MINASRILILEVQDLFKLFLCHLFDPFSNLSVNQPPIHKGSALVSPQLTLYQLKYFICGGSRYDYEGMPLYFGWGPTPDFFGYDAELLRPDEA